MTLECTGRCVILKYEVNIDMKKLLTALFRVDLFTSYLSIALTLGHRSANQRLTTNFSPPARVSGSADTGTATICKPVVRHYLTLDTPVS